MVAERGSDQRGGGGDAVPDEDLDLAARNFAAFWSGLAAGRGHPVENGEAFLAVDGAWPANLRILAVSPSVPASDVTAMSALALTRADHRYVLEDPYATVDATSLGLASRPMPVMVRHPGPLPAARFVDFSVAAVDSVEALATVEDVAVHGFPLEDYVPYRRGEFLPPALLDQKGFAFFLVRDGGDSPGGVPIGGCVVYDDGASLGVYWVTTLPDHRSRGVGRALMRAVLEWAGDRPVVLTASRQGRPLYDSLGFRVAGMSAWWA